MCRPRSLTRCPRVPHSVLGLALLAAACGSQGEDPSGVGPGTGGKGRRATVPVAEPLGSEDYPSEEFGCLYGEIRTSMEDVDRFPIGARQKSECRHFEDVEHMSDVLLVKGGRIQNAFVYVKSGYDAAAVPAVPEESAVLDQRGCIYTPHVLALRVGQKLQVLNSDPTNHNVNVVARRNASGNRNMGSGQAPIEFVFRSPEVDIRFKCDIHPWMGARLHVLEHPWFAVTDEAGRFRIPDVPPGEYVVEVVHEQLGRTRGKVSVRAGEASGFTLSLDG